MGINCTTDGQGRTTASLDTIVECSQAHAHGLSWLILRDDKGNQVSLFVDAAMARRLHQTWAATAPIDHSDAARRVA